MLEEESVSQPASQPERRMSQQKMSHSLNRFRTKMRKLGKGLDGKNSPDLATSNITNSTCSGSTTPTGYLGAPKDQKRKAVSVSTPPDISSSPVHQVSP